MRRRCQPRLLSIICFRSYNLTLAFYEHINYNFGHMANIKISTKAFIRRTTDNLKNLPSEEFTRDFAVRTLAIIGLIMLVVVWIYSILSFPPADFLVPLRYNSFLGVTALGAWYQLYTVPVLLLLIFIVNIFLAHSAYGKDKMVSYILMGASIFAMVCGSAVVINLSQVLSR